jgi:hypothetical protein
MITVAILINDEVIGLKYAVRRLDPDEKGVAHYRTDDNQIITHKPREGAKVLAKKLIDLMNIDIPFNDMPKDKQMELLLDLVKRKVK